MGPIETVSQSRDGRRRKNLNKNMRNGVDRLGTSASYVDQVREAQVMGFAIADRAGV